jgi:NTP pyrophosphatase (non-canonical NTP hydrolase)
LTLQELVEQTRQLQRRLDARAGRAWTVDAYVVELLAEAGTLADAVMVQEGYRRLRPDHVPPDIASDLAGILFLLMGIADHYDVDLEAAYRGLIRTATESSAAR